MAVVGWDPGAYGAYRGLRLRPALDLLAQVPEPAAGAVVDLGCGAGAVAAALRQRFADRTLIGVDSSPEMLAEAAGYDRLQQADIADWQPEAPPGLIYSNAALQWLGQHDVLLARLAGMLPSGGVLAVQMPTNEQAPSHALLREIAHSMFPDRFGPGMLAPAVQPARVYRDLLAPFGAVDLWQTEYLQELGPVAAGHPVRGFTQSTAMQRVLPQLTAAEALAFTARYDAALAKAYPLLETGGALFGFQRLFMVMKRF